MVVDRSKHSDIASMARSYRTRERGSLLHVKGPNPQQG